MVRPILLKFRDILSRMRDAAPVLIIATSNVLPYRLCRALRQKLLQLAGVKLNGRCLIRGPIYVQYPDRLTICDGVILNGHIHFENAGTIEIGANTHIGPGTMFFTMLHRGDYPRTNEPLPIRVGERVLFGGAVRVLPGVSIGDDAVILTGAIVAHDVLANTAVASVPARPLARAKPS